MTTRIPHFKPLTTIIAAALCVAPPITALARPAVTAASSAPSDASQSIGTPEATATNNQATAATGAPPVTSTEQKEAPIQLQALQVVGVRASQEQAIQLKRTATDIQDSITAENIGQLPDVTIADSLQRITGVQVDRVAGEGTTINVRGLPEVSTLLNGESFITPDNIYSVQPNYESLPSELFSGVDVIKSSKATIATNGISGTINLRTREPWDMPFGWTISGSAKASRGSAAKTTKPDATVFASYNDGGKWGFLLSASYSDLIHSYGHQGFEEDTTGNIAGENSSSALASDGSGYLTGWSGSPIPKEVAQLGDGNVDVNGDGKSNGAFYIPPELEALNRLIEPKRTGISAAFQADLGAGFTMTVNGFYTKETEYEEDTGVESLGPSQTGPTTLPLVSRDTGIVLTNPLNVPGEQIGNWNQNFFTTQVYNQGYGDIHPTTRNTKTDSLSRDFSAKIDYDDGGPFTGSVRFVNATASQVDNSINFESTTTNGSEWPNTLMPGVSLPSTVYMRPASQGGNYVYNPNGFGQFGFFSKISMLGDNFSVSIPADALSKLAQLSTYRVKSNYAQGDASHAGMNIARADGHYRFSDDLSFDFGLRNSIRSARSDSYVYVVREYAGQGASDPNGCLVRYTTSDIVLDGGGVAGACTAGNASGFYRGNELTGPISQLPTPISAHMEPIVNPGGMVGLTSWVLAPNAMRDPAAFYAEFHPGAATQLDPASTWNALLKERTAYGSANFQGTLSGVPFSGNIGVQVIRTNLGVSQFLGGADQPYGLRPPVIGTVDTHRSYTDVLPAINIAINLTPKLVLRGAESKRMMPLSLNEWGGSFSTDYTLTVLPDGKSLEAVSDASSEGNPNLNPWRSTNYGVSLEYYMNKSSMLSLAWFKMNIASFIEQSSVIDCSLPDQDGVVRGRCVPVSEPVQGTGAVLHGYELDYRQGLSFLPGLLRHTGIEVNATFAPSDTGQQDMAGNAVPFPDNSRKSGNLIVWYQDSKLQLRLAENYRSKRAVESNYAGINGFELYQVQTHYLDASASYQVTPHVQVFAQGQNLTNERENFYLVWPDEKIDSNLSERYFTVGVRGQF